MKHSAIISGIVIAWLAAASIQAADPRADDEAAIRKMIAAYVESYNKGDAKLVANFWSDDGEWITPDGRHTKGRESIEREMEAAFKESPGEQLEVLNVAIRFITDEVAVEEGTARVVRSGETPDDSTYIAIHVKKKGTWKLDSVRETSLPEATDRDTPLADLAWLVGDWVDQSKESTVETSVSWTKNQSFLSASFKLSVPGTDDLEGTQVIGWDPEAQSIRSWTFDSDGGIGASNWSFQDGRWLVAFSQVLADGRRASATNIYTPTDENSYTWESIDRKVGDEYLPNIKPVKVVRKGAASTSKVVKSSEEK